jgi:hypothetical protein
MLVRNLGKTYRIDRLMNTVGQNMLVRNLGNQNHKEYLNYTAMNNMLLDSQHTIHCKVNLSHIVD